MDTTIYFDGLCEPVNPGGVAAYGWLIAVEGKTIKTGKGIAATGREATNNLAEYSALIAALKAAKEMNLARPITITGDSQLVINHLRGEWRCRSATLIPLLNQAQQLLAEIGDTHLLWVPREQNQKADKLSRQAYKESGKDFKVWGNKPKRGKAKKEVRSRFVATFRRYETRYHVYAKKDITKMVFSDIKYQDSGELVRELFTFDIGKQLRALGNLEPGAVVEFTATLRIFKKGTDFVRPAKISITGATGDELNNDRNKSNIPNS